MAMYRVITRLAIAKEKYLEPGSFSTLDWLDERGLARLTLKGSISRVQPPPLAALPGWARRAKKVQEVTGVKDAEQFLEVDAAVMAEKMGVRPETAQKWRDEIKAWLTAEPAPTG